MRITPRPAATIFVLILLTSGLPVFGSASAAPPVTSGSGFPQCSVDLDVLFVFDTTGSMGGVIDSAKSGALSIMANVNAAVAGTRFGVAEYKDYPGVNWPGYGTIGGFGDYPWRLAQDLTTSTSLVQGGINPLFASGGADEPESMTRAMYESEFVSWRPAALKIVVLFTDARAHDTTFNGQNTGGDPGRDGLALTSDDLVFTTVAAQMAAKGIQEIGISVGSGGGAPYLQYAAQVTHGSFANLGADFVNQVTQLILALAPVPATDGIAVGVRAEAGTPANPFVQVAPVRAPPKAGTFDVTEQFAFQNLPQLQGFASAINDGTTGTLTFSDAHVRSNSTVAEVSLLNGLVYARGLHAVADSHTTPTGASSSSGGTSFDDLRVNGQVLTQPVAQNTAVPLPGVGVLILNEVRTAGIAGKSSEVLVNSLHLVVDTAQLRADVVVGRAYAGTTCAPVLGDVLRTFDDDAGIGGDASNDPATATPLTSPSVTQGRLVGSDRVDEYRIHAAIGEKVSAVLVPSVRAAVDVHKLPATPAAAASLPTMGFNLLQPGDFAARLTNAPTFLPSRVELNVDITGDWVLEVTNGGSVDGNYTLAVAVTPILLNAQNDANLGGDAPNKCSPAAPLLANGAYTGVLRDSDYDDWFTVHANIGDVAAVALKPTEDADGADFDLFVWSADCSQLVASSIAGKGIIPKGTPESVSFAPVVASADYRVQVHRVNGIGNWYLAVVVQDPQPTLAPINGEAGGDAGSNAATAKAITPPTALQGRLPDGDTQDWYKFGVTAADKRIVAVLDPQALSATTLTVYRPDGTVAATSNLALGAPQAVVVTVNQVGTWYVAASQVTGGGDYLLAVAVTQD